MGTSPLMSLGIRAMAANYASLQTTGHNIANAHVEGYSRQTAMLATAQGQFTGAGFFGRGVNVVSVGRAHNEFLTRESSAANSLAAMDSARLAQLQRMEGVFPPGEGGLGYATSELFSAMVDVSSQPADLSSRQVVLARAADLAARFSAAGTALDETQAGVNAELRSSVAVVNQLSKSIALANQHIAAAQGSGQPANDLLDQRERLINEVSQHIQVSRIEASDGSIGLFVAGGQRIVLGAEAATLAVVQDPADPSRSALAMKEGARTRAIDGATLGGGAMAGLLRFQNEDLAEGRNLVGRLAAAVGGAFNTQQMRGLNLQQPLGSVAAEPMFSMGATRALPHQGNVLDGSGQPAGSVALAIVDSAALQASDYSLQESRDVPGAWQLTRLSDGLQRNVYSGDVVDGVQIDISNAEPGDRFLLQPVARAANGMRALLDDPRDLAAAAPLVAVAARSNTGTATVASLLVTASPLPFPGESETLTFSRQVPAVDGFNYTVTSSITGVAVPWNTGQPVQGANGFTLQMNGVPGEGPQGGDSVTVMPTPATALATNNGNAVALLNLQDAPLAGGARATDAWATALADVGVQVQSAMSASDISSAVAQQAEQLRSSEVGVNLDEEAARLIQFQQSYQAAAKVLQVAQSLFDTLLQTAGA